MDKSAVRYKIISNKDETIPLFSNPWLERLTHTHPGILAILFSILIAYFVFYALAFEKNSLTILLGGLFTGVLLWTFLEYVMHRFLFHYAAKSETGRRSNFLIHGIHHAYPRDHTRLVSPLVVTIPISLLISFVFHVIFGRYFAALFAGVLVGYLSYDLLHFAIHHQHTQNPFFKALQRYHFHHHYGDNDRNFGVTSPLWDYVFGTHPELKSNKKSKL